MTVAIVIVMVTVSTAAMMMVTRTSNINKPRNSKDEDGQEHSYDKFVLGIEVWLYATKA